MGFYNRGGMCLQRVTDWFLIQSDQKVSVHLMITIHEVTSNVQRVPRQSPDIYWHIELCSRKPCSVHIPNVFCDGHLQIINYVGTVRIYWVFCTVIISCTETFWSLCIKQITFGLEKVNSRCWKVTLKLHLSLLVNKLWRNNVTKYIYIIVWLNTFCNKLEVPEPFSSIKCVEFIHWRKHFRLSRTLHKAFI
jgi:hypothetical protein